MLPVMRSASKINGIIFCMMLVGMFCYSLPALYGFARTQENPAPLFLDGKLVRQFESFYDKQFFLRDPSIKLWANIQHLVFREATSGAVLGRDGWLFTSQEYRIPNAMQANRTQQVGMIVAARDALEEQGIRLIMLPVPMKVDIYSEYRLREPQAAVKQLQSSLELQLHDETVELVELYKEFQEAAAGQQLFLRNDTHWSPEGAQLAAALLARQFPELIGQTTFHTQSTGHREYSGDLQRYLQFDPRLEPEYFELAQLDGYETLRQHQDIGAASLFGDIAMTVAVVGTSYTHMPEWNFPGALKQALSQDVMVVAAEAHGPFHAMQAFQQLDAAQRAGINTVIWEFPVRTLLAQKVSRKGPSDHGERLF